MTGTRYDKCCACSPAVVDAYSSAGGDFLVKVFNEAGYLEQVCGIKESLKQVEDIQDLDWDDE